MSGLSFSQYQTIASGLEECGYFLDDYNPSHADILDIWTADDAQGFIEVTICNATEDCIVLCPVDYQSDEMIEIINENISPLAEQLDDFFKH